MPRGDELDAISGLTDDDLLIAVDAPATAAAMRKITAANARTYFTSGLGTMALQSAANVAVTGGTITGIGTPSGGTDVATKSYVDAVSASGVSWKTSVRVATTANITLSGAQTIDGVAVVAGDRVLVKDQTTGSQNGIYVAASGAWSRATDADTSGEMPAGTAAFVNEGTVNVDKGYVLTTNNPITLGTTSLTFTNFTGGATAASGAGFVVVAAVDSPTKWKTVADYICDGAADQTEINLAITAANPAATWVSNGGIVQLAPGTYSVTGAVKMQDSVWLRGCGINNTLVFCGAGAAWAAYDASTPGAVIEPINANQQYIRVSDMQISGGALTKCIYDNSAGTGQTGWDSSDANHFYHDLYLNYGATAHMDLRNYRMAWVQNVRIFNTSAATTDGFYLAVVDSYFTNCDSGGCTGNGFNIFTVNSHFSNCKGWFSGLNGFYIQTTGSRNDFSNCQAQDNTRNGFLIEGGFNTFASCQADSNSYNGSPAGAPTGRTYMGFRASGWPVMMSACMAYDKNEGSRAVRQVYGLQVDSTVQESTFEVWTYQNFTGGVNLQATFNTTNHVRATGQTVSNRNPGRLVGTATYDPPSLSNAGTATTTVTVTGAAVGDVVAGLGHSSIAAAGWRLDGIVTATNTVTVVLTNVSAGTNQNLASGTLTAIVAKNT